MIEWLTSVDLAQWFLFAGIVLGVIILCLVLLLIYFRKHGKEEAAKKVEKALFFIKTVKDLVLMAESHYNYTGEEKKDFVIAKSQAEFAKKGYEYSDEEIVEEIKSNMEIADNVNKRGTQSRTH